MSVTASLGAENSNAALTLRTRVSHTAKKLKKPAGLVNIAPGNLKYFAEQNPFKKASYVAVRSDMFMEARQWLLEAEGSA